MATTNPSPQAATTTTTTTRSSAEEENPLKRSAPESINDQTTSNKRRSTMAKVIAGHSQSIVVRRCAPPTKTEGVFVAEPVLTASWRQQDEVNKWCAKLLPPLVPASQRLHDLRIILARAGQRLGLSLGERANVVVVTAAEVGEPGANAGAMAGDVLVTVGDEATKIKVSTVQEMVQALHARSEKLTLNITVQRDVWEPYQMKDHAIIGDGSGAPASVCGFSCEWCPSWWQKEHTGNNVIQVIQIYAPGFGSLVYSTGGGTVHERHGLPAGLSRLLGHARLLKVGVNARQNAERIANDFGVVVTGLCNLPGSNLKSLSVKYCPPDLHLNKILTEAEIRSYGEWSKWPLSGDQAKYAALTAVISYWVCACKRGGVWPMKHNMHHRKVDDIPLSQPVVPTISPIIQNQVRKNKHNLIPTTKDGVAIDALLPYRGQSSEALKGHSILVSGLLSVVSNSDFNTYITKHSALVCGTMMKDLTTLVVMDRGAANVPDKAAAADKAIPIVDLHYVTDLVRKHIQQPSSIPPTNPNKPATIVGGEMKVDDEVKVDEVKTPTAATTVVEQVKEAVQEVASEGNNEDATTANATEPVVVE
jgi:hypothetical protein